MIIFRVTENINIKTTDGTLVSYYKLKTPSNLQNDTLYITTYEDFQDIRRVFSNVDKKKYQAKVIDEKRVTSLEQFPKELGLEYKNQFELLTNAKKQLITKEHDYSENIDFLATYLNDKTIFLQDQLKEVIKPDIKVAILGNIGFEIGEMLSSLTALRIFYEELKKKFSTVILDIYLNSSDNRNFTRDKQIMQTQSFINKVTALSISVNKICEYDYYIDTSFFTKSFFYKELNYVDAWLYKFGIDFKKIDKSRKYNSLNLNFYKPTSILKQKFEELRLKGKILLFHPYSASVERSMPKEIATLFLKKLLYHLHDYTIVSALKIDGVNDANYIDLSSYSKSFYDFSYIISNVDNIITTDTATYHISEAFFIPTIVIFTNENPLKRIENFIYTKAVVVQNKSKNLSFFKFSEDALILHKFRGWKELKVKKIIKLLEKI
ncbi:hypothetical protein CP985_08470 [Malaciobacter mytili LMG 24559]|uniref:Glycosyltransferase, family 9 n=1 Tax=Malaciobacter mytili LMG 24559 TaxID=1032238 RepID=A0AAX2AIX0_9BACT|nr:hypothetical protein [Malaciobacter mytili]AXH15789.1 hypothetical protein AMYT_2244 [Malaciobacter mytili LMG 24559]RXK15391.1 hypothetical protein CP985_08470 [Malaciobacter mytili LMG 24559]